MPDPAAHIDVATRQFGDPRVASWHWPGELGGPRVRTEVREMLIRYATALAGGGVGHWWWREKTSGELVAQVGLNSTDVEGTDVVEVGWSVDPERWGEGFAPEAAAAALAWGFEVAGLERIVSFTMPSNLASRRVMEKLGMSYVRNFERKGLEQVLFEISPASRRGPVARFKGMLAEGQTAPDFTLPAAGGEELTLSDLRGKTVVLYFYPRADTPGCTTQACGVRDHAADYEKAGARVIGISPDPVAAVERFADKHELRFTLLGDEEHEVADAYGTWVEKSMYGKKYWGVQRATFLIDETGEIAKVFPKVSPKTHDEVVLKALAEI